MIIEILKVLETIGQEVNVQCVCQPSSKGKGEELNALIEGISLRV